MNQEDREVDMTEETTVLTREEARIQGFSGWNIRCNRCGSYGAEWLPKERHGWAALALCRPHARELFAEYTRHARTLRDLRVVRFEQEGDMWKAYMDSKRE